MCVYFSNTGIDAIEVWGPVRLGVGLEVGVLALFGSATSLLGCFSPWGGDFTDQELDNIKKWKSQLKPCALCDSPFVRPRVF